MDDCIVCVLRNGFTAHERTIADSVEIFFLDRPVKAAATLDFNIPDELTAPHTAHS